MTFFVQKERGLLHMHIDTTQNVLVWHSALDSVVSAIALESGIPSRNWTNANTDVYALTGSNKPDHQTSNLSADELAEISALREGNRRFIAPASLIPGWDF